MNNPLKISIAPPVVDYTPRNPTKLQRTHQPQKRDNTPLQLTPDLLKVFESVVVGHEQSIKEGIKTGTLDQNGNPLGTKYWDDGITVKRNRKGGPRRKVVIRTNMAFGDLTIVERARRVKAARPNLVERWKCRCSCGKVVVVPKYYLLRQPNPKTHCGCKLQTLKSQNPREYRIYMMIHQRILNPKHISYEHYKARGITLFEEWRNDLHPKDGFKKFFEHVKSSPSQWHSLDRIHNNKGYEPGNLRWATATEQRANQGDKIGGYTSEEIADMGYTEDEFIEKIIAGEIQ